jgi:hypothetical protein
MMTTATRNHSQLQMTVVNLVKEAASLICASGDPDELRTLALRHLNAEVAEINRLASRCLQGRPSSAGAA